MLDYIGLEGQRRLRATMVAVIEMGGLGSLIATQLTAMDVGELKIVDRDIVDISNLHRQYLYGMRLVEYSKIEAAAIKLKRLNPDVKIVPYATSFDEFNAEKILESVDVVVDGLDRIKNTIFTIVKFHVTPLYFLDFYNYYISNLFSIIKLN